MSQGKRYTAKERKEILEFLDKHTYRETMKKYGVSQMSLARWVKNKKRQEPPREILDEDIRNELEFILSEIKGLDHVEATALVTNGGDIILPLKNKSSEITPNDLISLGMVINGFRPLLDSKKMAKIGRNAIIFEIPLGGLIANLMDHMVLVTIVKKEHKNAIPEVSKVVNMTANQFHHFYDIFVAR